MHNLNKLQPVDKATILYLSISIILICINTVINTHNYGNLSKAIIMRGVIVIIMTASIKLSLKYKNRILIIIRNVYPLAFLGYLYPETGLSKNIFFNDLDSYCIQADKIIFGINPAIEFSLYMQSIWTKELLNFGYFCYFIIILLVPIIFYYKKPELIKKVLFIIITSFYTYYLIYCMVPIIGPQFYFPHPYNYVSKNGVFPYIVGLLQSIEMPTGAFPSSHVGITLILLIICHKYKIKLFYSLIPIFTIIIFATVYIKAHYAIDVIAGIISAFIIYKFSSSLYNTLS